LAARLAFASAFTRAKTFALSARASFRTLVAAFRIRRAFDSVDFGSFMTWLGRG